MVDATAAGFGGMRTYAEYFLRAYAQGFPDDEVFVIAPSDLNLPASSVRIDQGLRVFGASRADLYLGGRLNPLLRRTKADVYLALTPILPPGGVDVPSAVVCHDLRHLMLPREFSVATRAKRWLFYGSGLRNASRVIAISEATAATCIRLGVVARSRLSVVPLGADHVEDWSMPERTAGAPSAVSFAHHTNKSFRLCMDAWRERGQHGSLKVTLNVLGLRESARDRLEAASSVPPDVTLHPYLSQEAFQRVFGEASCVLMPSTLEGFGLPVAEGLFLRKRVVISPDPALVEVAAGHAVVMDDMTSSSLNRAVDAAMSMSQQALDAAAQYAATMTWRRTAAETRQVLVGLVEGGPRQS